MGENGIKITVDSGTVLDLVTTTSELTIEVRHLKEQRKELAEYLEKQDEIYDGRFKRLSGAVGGVKAGSKQRDEALEGQIAFTLVECKKTLTVSVNKWGKRIAGCVVFTGFAIVSRVELAEAWKFVTALLVIP